MALYESSWRKDFTDYEVDLSGFDPEAAREALGILQAKTETFASDGWGYIAADLEASHKTDLTLLVGQDTKLEDVVRHQARIRLLERLLALPEQTSESIRQLSEQLNQIEGEDS